MATDRWDGDSIHFIDYTPETVRTLLPDMDGVVVAERQELYPCGRRRRHNFGCSKLAV